MSKAPSIKLSSMRFMLRKAERPLAAPPASTALAAQPAAAASASAPAPAPTTATSCSVLPSGPVYIEDNETTVVRADPFMLFDSGGSVEGRRSYGGANKGIESAAKAAYAEVMPAADVTDEELARKLGKKSRRKDTEEEVEARPPPASKLEKDRKKASKGKKKKVSS
jgi:hypothetical protein